MPASMLPIIRSDLAVGRSVPWPIYDRGEALLLREGCIIDSESMLEQLAEVGFVYVDENGRPLGSTLRVPRPHESPDAAANGQLPPVFDASEAAAKPRPAEREERTVDFMSAGLRVGEAVQLRYGNGGADRFMVRLIGAVERRSVLVTHPQVDGKLSFIKDGTVFQCRSFRGRHAYAFETSVSKVQLQPWPYLHLNYPGQVTATVLRTAHRAPVQVICSARREGERGMPCTIRDLSVGGAQVHADRPLATAGEVLDFAFRLVIDGETTTFEVKGRLRSVRPADDGARPYITHGVEFLDMALPQRRALKSYVLELLVADL